MSATQETDGYPCGCVYYSVNGLIDKAIFCQKHRVTRKVLAEITTNKRITLEGMLHWENYRGFDDDVKVGETWLAPELKRLEGKQVKLTVEVIE
jgi:hypothetical protein